MAHAIHVGTPVGDVARIMASAGQFMTMYDRPACNCPSVLPIWREGFKDSMSAVFMLKAAATLWSITFSSVHNQEQQLCGARDG